MPAPKNMICRKDVASTYGVDLRTVDRWRQEKLLPRPKRTPAGRPYWTPAQLAAAENKHLRRYSESERKRVQNAAWLLHKKQMAQKSNAIKPDAAQLEFRIKL